MKSNFLAISKASSFSPLLLLFKVESCICCTLRSCASFVCILSLSVSSPAHPSSSRPPLVWGACSHTIRQPDKPDIIYANCHCLLLFILCLFCSPFVSFSLSACAAKMCPSLQTFCNFYLSISAVSPFEGFLSTLPCKVIWSTDATAVTRCPTTAATFH